MENTASFDLNRAIAEWRHHLGQSPAYRADDLEEMELHLRDASDQLRGAGLTDEEVFLVATHRVGPPQALEAEFAKINGRSVWLDRVLWILLGVQAWVLMGVVANMLSSLAGLFAFKFLAGSSWLPRVPSGSLQPVPILLVIMINLLAIGAFCALCWMQVRRIGPRLPDLLRQPGWLARRLIVLCAVISLASLLRPLTNALAARTIDAATFGNLAISSSVAELVLFVAKTVVITWLGVALVRRHQRLAA
jgi:hypothetical protein